ncbi:MAG: ATP-binding protein, partial [Bacteroidales bacterium]|nr:ATP-binding protein [Bacteroidales bacterium]
ISNILLYNAIKYALNDSEIYCLFEKDGNDLILTIENDGPYITEEEIKDIFKKGVRGKNAEKTARGHGFGMDFLNSIVKAHDGSVQVESENNYVKEGIPYGIFRCIITLPIQ